MKKTYIRTIVLFLCFFSFSQGYSAKGYEVVEDLAKLPLLNPSLSERKVAKLKLDNKLEVYIISDPGADQSAASVCVAAGSWSDPKEYPGMAHFCEHMLFMGTATYPKEFEYMQFISDNGGNVNASTWPDRTIYMFSINNDGFEGALDRFSHFFIDPLFSTSCINRELHAVDQEHAKNLENDGWRQYMIFKETGNQDHPNACFSTGNADTLSGIPQSALKEWYESNYSANQMHLVVLSPLPMEKLIQLVLQDFSKVPNRNIAKTSLSLPMSSSQQNGRMIYVKPVKDLRMLSLAWEIPGNFASDNERWGPELIAYALGNEGENSLLSELRKEKIAESINVAPDRFGKNYLLFNIDIVLTEEGLGQIDTAIAKTFQAIAKIKETGIPPYLFHDVKKTTTLQYQYQSRDDAFHVISKHAHDILDEDLKSYPLKSLIPTKYDPEFLSAFLQLLTPESCSFFMIADPAKTKVFTDRKEKWMGAEYAVRDLPKQWLASWRDSTPSSTIGLPEENLFLPSNLQLAGGSSKQKTIVPSLISNDEGSKIYFAQDGNYLLPEIAAFFGFKSPLLDGTARSSALADLYLKAIKEKLSSSLFFASSAGINAYFSQKNLKFSIVVDGFSEKAPLLLKDIFGSLKSNSPTNEQFDIYKQSLLSAYDNASKELPIYQAMSLLASMITNDSPTSVEKYKALADISYEEFISFSQTLFETCYIEGLLYGNLKESDAKTLSSELKAILANQPFPVEKQMSRHVLVLPERQGPYMVVEKTPRQGNGVVLLLEEGPFSFEKRAASQLLSLALHDSFFDTLRTKQQTAYFARSWDMEVERQLLQYFAVQSSTHQPRDLLSRFELFLEDFAKNFSEKIPQDRFENMQKMLAIKLEMPPENLMGMSALLNSLAFEYEGDFHWMEKRIASVKSLTYSELEKTVEELLTRNNTRRLAVLMEGVLPPEYDFSYKSIDKENIADFGSYVSWK